MARVAASITGGPRPFYFRVNPKSVDWTYSLNTSTQETAGGRVIQILSVNFNELVVQAESGNGGEAYLRSTATFFRELIVWQKEHRRTVLFQMPSKKISLRVFAESMDVKDRVGNILRPFTMTFKIQEDVRGVLKQKTISSELARLERGIGFKDTVYNNPEGQSNPAENAWGITQGSNTANTANTAVDAAMDPTQVASGGTNYGNNPASSKAQTAVRVAKSRVGLPYIWGGTGPEGYDCSGLTSTSWAAAGVTIPRATSGQINAGHGVTAAQAAPGDLVFLTRGHVMMYIGNGQCVHAPQTGDRVKISRAPAAVAIRRVG